MTTIIKNLIKEPRVTEKASMMQEMNVYSFNVASSANKAEIKKAIFALYKVKPVKVNVVTVPAKRVSYRGKTEVKGTKKKALVYLKEGDKIEFV